jgi:thiamine-phosphate pyrophosphorylase
MTLPRLHVVTDGAVLRRPDFAAQAARLARLGPRLALHVRDRAAGGRALHDAAAPLARPFRAAGALLVVNARPDVAAAIGADGVQLGAGDLSPAEARTVAPGVRVGRSVHGVIEAGEAVGAGADWLTVGTIYPTASHPGLPPAGIGRVRAVAAFGRPAIAIGGVRPDRVAELRTAGAYGVAVLGAVWGADDPLLAAEALLDGLEAA